MGIWKTPAWSSDRWTCDAEAMVEMGDVNLEIYGKDRRVATRIPATAETFETDSRDENMKLVAQAGTG